MRGAAASLRQQLAQVLARCLPAPLSPPLRAAQAELRRSLHLAFRLAATHDRTVVLEPCRASSAGRIAVRLPNGVHWGRPPAIPLPPALVDSGWRSGVPNPITVMPRQRAASNVWFLHHGRAALCLRLELSGSMELLRYRPLLGAWVPLAIHTP